MILGMPTREAYGRTLVKLGKERKDIVVLDADLSRSTTTRLFAQEFPDRFFDCGIAEQNMMGIAAGLAASGKMVFASTFSVFATARCFDQLRVSVAQPRLNVKIVASHGGITVGEDGASHHAVEDIALACALPGFTVIVPADEIETAQAIKAALDTYGPFYIRCGRPRAPIIYSEDYRFTIGDASMLRDGNDVTIIAYGFMVVNALEAAQRLEAENIHCRVLNMSTIKPVDREAISSAAKETGAILIAEEHLQHGGLGSLVAQVVAELRPVPMAFVALKDTYAESGKAEELLQKYGLTATDIIQAVRSLLARKGN